MTPFRTILCPIDFSDCSLRAFQLASTLASFHGARLLLVHVIDVPYGKHGYGGGIFEARPSDYPQRQLEALQHLRPQLPEVTVEFLVRDGDPVVEIMHLSHDRECDLIVMGNHGQAGLRHMLVGGVAEQILRQAHCPVVTVRPEVAVEAPPRMAGAYAS
ncbi:MAG: universal stress protein [Gemmataceae bacterium]